MIMENTICPECKFISTHHTCEVCGTVVCTQCISDRGFNDINDLRCKECNQNPVHNPI